MDVSSFQHFMGWFAEHNGEMLRLAGDMETRALRRALPAVLAPCYIAGLARAGTTTILELVAEHPDVATHRYRDFPFVAVPFWWDRFVARHASRAAEPVERAHRDGIRITPDSPEAMEEILWMLFLPDCHDPAVSNVLGRDDRFPAFEAFYVAAVRKLLLARGRSRYVAKNTYDLARIGFLARLFPDARFVFPVRDPLWHIASLMKQHRLLSHLHAEDPRTLAYMRRSGHFEFGLDRRPLNLGDSPLTAEVQRHWREGREVEGWALYWQAVHEHVLRLIEGDRDVASRTLVLSYEELCRQPRPMLARLYAHLRLAPPAGLVEAQAGRLREPSYYRPEFSAAERDLIAARAGETYRRLRGLAEAVALAS